MITSKVAAVIMDPVTVEESLPIGVFVFETRAEAERYVADRQHLKILAVVVPVYAIGDEGDGGSG